MTKSDQTEAEYRRAERIGILCYTLVDGKPVFTPNEFAEVLADRDANGLDTDSIACKAIWEKMKGEKRNE